MVSRPIRPPLQKTMMGRLVAKMSNQSVELSAWIGLHEGKEVHCEGVELNGMALPVVREWIDLWMKSSFCFLQVSSQSGGETSQSRMDWGKHHLQRKK